MQRLLYTNIQRGMVNAKGFAEIRSQSIRFKFKTLVSSAHQNRAYGSWDYDQPESSGASSSVDNDLVSIASELMNHIHLTHHSFGSDAVLERTDPDYARHVAATALAAAEANGAIPPLSSAQRHAFQAALEEVARHLTVQEQAIDTKEQIDPEDPAHWFEMSEEGANEIIIKPEFRSLFEQLATLNFKENWGSSGGEHTYDSKQQGGEVGNISQGQNKINSSSSASADKKSGNFAEGATERTQHAAEADAMNLEVNAFAPHAKDVGRAHGGVVSGDAPVAGGGAQTAGDDDGEERSPAAGF